MKETTHRLIETFFKEHPEMSYLFDRACLAVEKMAGVYPVSYTHLDVYKRQLEKQGARTEFCIFHHRSPR